MPMPENPLPMITTSCSFTSLCLPCRASLQECNLQWCSLNAVSTGTRLPAAARREQILDATKAIAAQRGFHAVSIDAVARAAGISRPIVYDHFHDLAGPARGAGRARGRRAPASSSRRSCRRGSRPATRGPRCSTPSAATSRRPRPTPTRGGSCSCRRRARRSRCASTIATRARRGGRGARGRDRARCSASADILDPELVARMLSTLADEAVRLVLTDPERYPVERLLARRAGCSSGWSDHGSRLAHLEGVPRLVGVELVHAGVDADLPRARHAERLVELLVVRRALARDRQAWIGPMPFSGWRRLTDHLLHPVDLRAGLAVEEVEVEVVRARSSRAR